MARHIVLLRGINLPRHKRISMPELREALEDAGFRDIKTYVQSGNVVLSSRATPKTVARKVEHTIADRFGLDVDVVVRTRDELAKVISREPFGKVASDPKRFQVTFLAAKPDADVLGKLEAAAAGGEQLVARDRELYHLAPERRRPVQARRAPRRSAPGRDRDGAQLDHGHDPARPRRRVGPVVGLRRMATQTEKAEAFRALHEGEPFVIPNPWDAGSAKVLAGLGFQALATTSSGFAFTLGRLDGGVSLDELGDSRRRARPRRRPAGLGRPRERLRAGPEDAAHAITRAAEAGAVGGSIEDFDPEGRLYGQETPSSAWPPRPRPRATSASRSRSPRAPRTTSAATPTWTTRSRGCRPTSARAPTSSTRPAFAAPRRCGPSSRRRPSP